MTQEIHYVKCGWCEDWDLNRRTGQVCSRCKNTQNVQDPKEVLCNLCGGCMCPLGTINEQVPHGLYNASVTGGYESYHLMDLHTYVFSLCEECLRKLFNQCKVKPDVAGFHYDTPTTWEEDQQYYEYRIWQDTGGAHQAYLNKKCNMIKDCPNTATYTKLINGDFTEDCCCEEHKGWYAYTNSQLTKFIPNVLKPFL